jgi:mono/diheme cytochrome c family protein
MALLLVAVLAGGGFARAADTDVGPDFLRDVRPIFKAHCFRCHGSGSSEGELRLDRKPLAMKGGETGRAIEPGQAAASLLVRLIEGRGPGDARMPPDGEGRGLRQKEIRLIRDWINRGAAWPDGIDDQADRLSLWSLRPIRSPPIPRVHDATWVQNPIDSFVLAQLEARQLVASARARPGHLIRRATLDLLGLPPTPSQVDRFTRDPSAGAFERVVDRLLANPHYGERWGRHWLDLVRYADTNGYEVDGVKPLAWKYRDWVIGALNADQPYDRFVIEQLAGDEIASASTSSVLATGFHRVGPWDAERGASVQKSEVIEELYNELDDMVSTTSQVFLGLTIGCARCHDHKFDPLTARDYYSMVAVFRGLTREHKGRTELARAALPPGQLADKDLKAQPQGYFFFEPSPIPPVTHLLDRGNPNQPGIEVTAAVPAALVDKQPAFDDPDKFTSRRRISLARWIMSDDNPLTRRVIVNRVWQYHFGNGLVRTANDFGVRGNLPTHPELLDWLAEWFRVDAGYSLKKLHRLIMTSRTYASSKRPVAASARRDVDNLFLSHFPVRRLEVEAIRDSMLAVSGRLNDRLYGAPMYPFIPADALRSGYNPSGVWQPFNETDANRRTIYAFLKRTLMIPFLETLDFCDTSRSAERREVTTVAPQALELFNGEFVNRQSRHFADRVIAEAGTAPASQLEHAFRLALGRSPRASERTSLLRFLSTETRQLVFGDLKRFERESSPSALKQASGKISETGLTLWLDASTGVTLDQQKHVTSWASRVGPLVATGHGDPESIAGAIGKRPAIRFSGHDWFSLSGSPVSGQAYTLMAVVTDLSAATPGARNLIGNWDGSKGNSTTSIFLGTTSASKGVRSVRLTDAFALREKLILNKPATPFLLTGVSGPDNARVFQNRRLLDQLGSALPSRKLDTGWTIGRQGTLDGEYWNGLVAELLVWNRSLGEAELSMAWQQLGVKYGVVDPLKPRLPLTTAAARRLALVQVCRVILNLNEFVYTD